MIIYDYYTTDDVMMNEPCLVENIGEIYPVLVKDYNRFSKSGGILMIGKQHTQGVLLREAMAYAVMELSGSDLSSKDDMTVKTYFYIVAEEIAKMISIVVHKQIKFTTNWDFIVSGENKYFTATFTDKDNTILINETNWEIFRGIVMKQNNIQEEKVYEDPLYAKWARKAQIANSKNSENITLGDMIAIVSCETGKTYDEIKNQNVLQLHSDYQRVNHVANYEATTLFRTVTDKVKIMNFASPIISEIYRDKTDDYTSSINEIANKL